MIDLKKKKGQEQASDAARKISLHKESHTVSETESTKTDLTDAINPENSSEKGESSQKNSASSTTEYGWNGCFGYCGCLGVLALFSVCLRGGFWGLVLGIAILLGVCRIGIAIRNRFTKKH